MRAGPTSEERPGATGAPCLSLIVLSCNTRELLRLCLTSILRHPPRRSWEVICVDDASRDGSAAMVRDCFPQVRLLVNPRNRGYAASSNVALRAARGRFLLLLNSDVEILEDTFDGMVEFLETHPEAGAAGQKLLNPDRTLQVSCRGFPDLALALRASFLPARWRRASPRVRRYYMADFPHDRVAEVDMAAATCCIVRREVLETVGLLDEGYFLYVADADWFYRMRQAGWRIFFLPSAPVVHHGGVSTSQRSFPLLVDLHRGMYRYYRKHLAHRTPLWLRPLVLPGIISRAMLFTLRRALLGGRRVLSDDFK